MEPPDKFHGLFFTTDDRLLKFQSERIKLVTPGEFVRRTEGDG